MSAPSLPAKTGSVKPRLRGLKALLTHQTFRRISQLFFAGFIVFIAIQHIVIGEDGPIVTASAETFCPFGGLETLYKYITSGGSYVSHTHLSNLVVLVAVLVTCASGFKHAWLLRSFRSLKVRCRP